MLLLRFGEVTKPGNIVQRENKPGLEFDEPKKIRANM
jgi:hypothetical protein